MDLEFGKKVYGQALELQEQGKDPNQIAKILCDRDNEGSNYGIGIVLGGDGQAAATSAVLLEYASLELELSKRGTYMNSGAILEELRTAALKWQRIPEKYWDCFELAIPSDAGTGAVKTGVEIMLMLNPSVGALGVEELGWPAYEAIAKLARVRCEKFPADGLVAGEDVLPIYQAGPMNTTGQVRDRALNEARAQSAAETGIGVVLDRAYSGFEFAKLLDTQSYEDIMRMSFELQIQPFVEKGTPFCLAVSPTKSFVSFALRPGGLLLFFCPERSRQKEIGSLLSSAIRARGSAFEHPTTRALAKAMTKDLTRLEMEHKAALKRVAEAEAMWRKYVRGTPIEYLYSDDYAGLFRNPRAREDAMIHIYNEHIYPVFASERCRQNVTGIPSDEQLAKKHVAVFAEQCY